MSALLIKSGGVIPGPSRQYSPLNAVFNPDGSSPLHAAWLLGTDYHLGAPSEGFPLTDLSGNGHTLIRTGTNVNAGVKAKHAIGNASDYWTTSFTVDSVVAAGGVGEICIMTVAISPATGGEAHTFASSAANAAGFGNRSVAFGTTATFDASLTQNDGAVNTNRTFGNPVEPDRATEYFTWGANFKINTLGTYMENAGEENIPYITSELVPTGAGAVGGGALRIATSNVNTLTLRMLGLLVFRRNLSPAEMKKVHRRVQAIAATKAVIF